MLQIGVIALQGAVREHILMLERCGARAVPVKKRSELSGLTGLVLPGGESTTIGRLMTEYGLLEEVRDLALAGMPVFGTCAGMILLARRIIGSNQPGLRLMDISVRRNAFGRQRESFETDLVVPALGRTPFRAVFIRAPYIEQVGDGVEVMAAIGDRVVLARQGNWLAAAFHPELTEDNRVHQYFIDMVHASRRKSLSASD